MKKKKIKKKEPPEFENFWADFEIGTPTTTTAYTTPITTTIPTEKITFDIKKYIKSLDNSRLLGLYLMVRDEVLKRMKRKT